MAFCALITLACFAVTASSAPCSEDAYTRPTATIDSGIIAGTTTTIPSSTVTVNQFLGIPFGAPPVRFSPPQRPNAWESVYDASEYKPACIQKFNYPEQTHELTIKFFDTPGPPAGESEDCLNLNVFAPASAAEGSKAVLVWIYGGSFSFGSGSRSPYDGSSFAANQDVVVVTINYRTNVFGFPGSPDLPETERNLGWLDQRLALDWVQRNIAFLGGDPARVTIFGESAGAGSVDALVTTPPNPIPFHAAIMQSGQASIFGITDVSATSWKKLAKVAKCPSEGALECIRLLPATKLKEIVEQTALDFGPVPDGGTTWVDKARQTRLNSTDEKPLIARVPVLIGSNADEGRIGALGQNDAQEFLRQAFPGDLPNETIAELLKAYPIGAPGIKTENDRISAIMTEYSYLCPTKVYVEDNAKVGIKAWRYYFNASFPNSELFEGAGAYHTSEISPVFGTYLHKGVTEFQVDVSKAMQTAWADFAKDPDHGPGWDRVPQLAVFGGGARVGDDDSGKKALSTMDSAKLDKRCWLYQDLIDAITL